MLPERRPLRPIARFQGTLALPGSKSLSNRVLLLSALADGETEVTRALDSEDTEVMLAALRDLGVGVRGEPGPRSSLWIAGKGGPLDAPAGRGSLFLGNARTALRPPTPGVPAAGRGSFPLSGVPRMPERPIGDLLVGLEQLGARIHCLERNGCPPLSIEASGIRGGTARLSGATSSQFLSALLMAAPLAAAPVVLEITDRLVSEPYVTMTLALMARFGARVERPAPFPFEVAAPQRYRPPGAGLVEGDASSASYFLAGAAITGGKVRVEGCGSDSLQGDARFADVLARMGAHARFEPAAIEVEGEGPLEGIDVDLSAMPDAAMTLAVASLFAQGPTT